MSKKVVFIIAVGLFGACFSLPANAAIKAGASCTTNGQVKISQGIQFKCVKSGKKLIWNKGAAIKKPTPTPTPEVPYVGATEIERDLYLKMDAIVTEWTSYLSAQNNNKVKLISENPSHPRNEENRLSAEVSFEIIGKMLPGMFSPMYYMYETAEWPINKWHHLVHGSWAKIQPERERAQTLDAARWLSPI